MSAPDNYTHARILAESLDVFCGQFEDGERSDPTIGILLAGASQARALLAVADTLRLIAGESGVLYTRDADRV